MAQHNKLGKDGELIAFMFLQREGFKILATNFSWQKAEVDIIAINGEFLVFTEVKTRGSEKFGPPEQAITSKKESLYKEAAEAYIAQHPSDLEIRFDVISIIISKEQTKIEHFPNAF